MHQPQSSTFQQVKHVSRQCSTFEGKYYLASYVVAENGVGLWGCWTGKEKKEESRIGEGPRRKWGKVCLKESDSVLSEDALLSHKRERKRTGIPLNPCLVGRGVVPTAR